MKIRVLKVVPWLITAVALYVVFKDTDWSLLFDHVANASVPWLAAAVMLTILSYLLRAYRWEYFFPALSLKYANAFKVLILGFFMNNILPARTGELVRAHIGAKVTGRKRTLVLATIASERLADGLVLSLMFVTLGLGVGSVTIRSNLLYVALLFGAVTAAVILVLAFRERLFALLDKAAQKFNRRAFHYATDRIRIFINGLAPLFTWSRIPAITFWSIVVWGIELLVYYCITMAFSITLPLSHCVIFLVTVNFSSLIPAAPGGVGVIEAVTTVVLTSLGVPREIALSMVLSQHLIQYLVVGIPGAFVMFTWKKEIKTLEDDKEE